MEFQLLIGVFPLFLDSNHVLPTVPDVLKH